MPTREKIGISANPLEWRPQTIHRGRFVPTISNPLVEPLWSGDRVIVHFRESDHTDQWGDIKVLDEIGEDALELAPIALDFLRRSVRANEAVIDGIITTQATGGGEGTVPVLEGRTQPLKRMFVGGPGSDVTFEPPKGRRHEGEPAFVALDLLRLDGESLLEVPLLERKRQLEATIQESELVRLSPVVRPPLRQWFASWRAAGMKGLVLKSSNSRYEPGGETSEWATVERMPRA
jgi:ATP dependent DNA ligase-like protein